MAGVTVGVAINRVGVGVGFVEGAEDVGVGVAGIAVGEALGGDEVDGPAVGVVAKNVGVSVVGVAVGGVVSCEGNDSKCLLLIIGTFSQLTCPITYMENSMSRKAIEKIAFNPGKFIF